MLFLFRYTLLRYTLLIVITHCLKDLRFYIFLEDSNAKWRVLALSISCKVY